MIKITKEQIEVISKQKEQPVLGTCDICKKGLAIWTVSFHWNRQGQSFAVPQLRTYAFVCEGCFDETEGMIERVRAHLEKQANYRAEKTYQFLGEVIHLEESQDVRK